MRVGIQLPEVERPVPWNEMRQIAVTAEQIGFDSIWVGDHLLFRDDVTGTRGPWEAWSILAALAAVTERVELGPLVASTSFHAPAMLVKKAATVDEISGGRLTLGLGSGWNEPDYTAFGFPYDKRVSRFAEAFTIIRKLIRKGETNFEGSFYSVADSEIVPRPRPGIPIMVGSNGPRMLRITAPHIDKWNSWYTWFGNRASGLGDLLENLRAACDDTGADYEGIEKTVAVYVRLDRGSGRIAGSEDRPKAPPITGSHDEIAEELAEFERAGIGQIQLVVDPIDVEAVEELAGVLELLR